MARDTEKAEEKDGNWWIGATHDGFAAGYVPTTTLLGSVRVGRTVRMIGF